MVIETETQTRRPIIKQVHSDGRNGHRAGTVSLGVEAGIKVPEAPSLQEQIFAQDPIKKRLKELDEVSEEWMNAKLLGRNYTASIWEADAWAAGEKLKATIEGVRFPDLIESEIGEMYEKLRTEVGEEDVAAMQNFGQNEIFLGQKGKKGVSGAFKKCLAVRFAGEAVRRRNEARLEMLQKALRDNPQDRDGAWRKSEVLSHAKSNLPVVVQRWQMRSSQK